MSADLHGAFPNVSDSCASKQLSEGCFLTYTSAYLLTIRVASACVKQPGPYVGHAPQTAARDENARVNVESFMFVAEMKSGTMWDE